MKIKYDPLKIDKKPSNEEMRSITDRLKKNEKEVSITEFANIIRDGHTWCGSYFIDDSIDLENWNGQAVFAHDFDNKIDKITREEVIERAKEELQITPSITYNTFSHQTDHPRFRMVFCINEPIEDVQLATFIMKVLHKIFPEADKSCKNLNRLFFPGSSVTSINDLPIELTLFTSAILCIGVSKDAGKTRNAPSTIPLIKIDNKMAPKGDHLYINNKSIHFSADYQLENKKNKINLQNVRGRIKILDDFLQGKWLHHPQLFGLATNLYYVKGGLKVMKQVMEKFNNEGVTHYTDNNFAIFSVIKKYNYPPQPLSYFSPYPEDHIYFNLLEAGSNPRGKVEVINQPSFVSLIYAENKMKVALEEAINSNDTCIYVFKLPTGIGKSELLTTINKVVIATPTNDLKNELGARMKVNYSLTPDPIFFETDSLNKKIASLRKVGLPAHASAIIHSVAEQNCIYKYSLTDVEIAKEWKSSFSAALNSDRTLITTHSRMLHQNMDVKSNSLIFDEDPLQEILKIQSFKLSKVIEILSKSGKRGIASEIQSLFSHYDAGKVVGIPKEMKELIIDDLLHSNDFDELGNVFGFAEADLFLIDAKNQDTIYYLERNELPNDKKIIILSATAPIHIYKELCGNRVKVIDLGLVGQKGTINQYTSLSCSRQGLKNYAPTIAKKVGSTPVITFKAHKKMFCSPSVLHFGNTSGYDELKGKNIAVVGTPHRNNAEYFLIATALGYDYTSTDFKYDWVEHNGLRFKFNSFQDENLRKIQFALIESDLIQAVGRARPLREEVIVSLYSSFPLQISTKFIY